MATGLAARSRWLLLLASLPAASASAGGVVLHNTAVAGGGQTVTDPSGRFRLIGTTGEAVQHFSQNNRFRLTAGFPATIGTEYLLGDGRCTIFCDGFEQSAPAQTAFHD